MLESRLTQRVTCSRGMSFGHQQRKIRFPTILEMVLDLAQLSITEPREDSTREDLTGPPAWQMEFILDQRYSDKYSQHQDDRRWVNCHGAVNYGLLGGGAGLSPSD